MSKTDGIFFFIMFTVLCFWGLPSFYYWDVAWLSSIGDWFFLERFVLSVWFCISMLVALGLTIMFDNVKGEGQ